MGGHQGGDIDLRRFVVIPQTFSTQQEDTPIKTKSSTNLCRQQRDYQ